MPVMPSQDRRRPTGPLLAAVARLRTVTTDQRASLRLLPAQVIVLAVLLGLNAAILLSGSAKAQNANSARTEGTGSLAVFDVPIPERASKEKAGSENSKPIDEAKTAVSDEEIPLPARSANDVAVSTEVTANATPATPLPIELEAPDARARYVLEKHCARCHQSGKLVGVPTAAGGIANILDLEELARNPGLVRRGTPDASPLYQQMIGRQMPFDVFRQGHEGTEPTADDVNAIRRWIKLLPADPPNNCIGRRTMNEDMVGDTIAQWQSAIGAARAADTRFISLAHLYKGCADDTELANYRQAITLLFNALTWSEKPIRLETVGDALVVMAVRLSDVGWTPEQWQALVAEMSPAQRIRVSEKASTLAGTAVPVVAADWLAYRSMRPDLYQRLLGLPGSRDGLAKLLKLDLSSPLRNNTLRRGAVLVSGQTGAPRIIERFAHARGPLWFAYDYESAKEGSILDQPLLPWAASGEEGRKAEGTENKSARLIGSQALFTLPNGLPAFMMFDSTGASVGQRPVSSAMAHGKTNSAAPSEPSHSLVPAGECVTCHARGVITFVDSLGDHLASDVFHGDDKARETARTLTFSQSELAKFLADDRRHVDEAFRSAGAAPDRSIDGHDLVSGLAARYMRDLDLNSAAADLLMPPRALQVRLSALANGSSPIAAELAMRLTLGRLTREEFEALRPLLGQHDISSLEVTAAEPEAAISKDEDTSSKPVHAEMKPTVPRNALHLWPEKISYNRGDNLVLNVRSGRACYLTVIDIDGAGKATVLFPNEYARNNLIGPRHVVRVPARDAPYRFLMKKPGTESFVAICEVDEPVPAGVSPDLLRENFTALGDWEEFLDASFKAAKQPRVPIDNGDDLDRRRRQGRAAKARSAPALAPAQSRASITVTIVP